MDQLLVFTAFGLFTGAAYAIAASGLVLTYTTTRVFNIAHGAFGMLFAFTFWQFSVLDGMPIPIALPLVLLVVAPATGWLVHRYVTRGLGESPVGVSLVVTVGLFVACIGIAQQIWPAGKVYDQPRAVPEFYTGHSFPLGGGATITAHQLITIVASIAVAAALYVLLYRSRIGTAMRASVDDPDLLRLFGGRPDRVASLAWMIGMSLAALAGILLAPAVGLDYYQLTFLVINAYAAAMVGRLRSLPLTFVGAMALGLIDSLAVGFVPAGAALPLVGVPLAEVIPVIPPIFLFVAAVLAKQERLRVGQVRGLRAVAVPTRAAGIAWAAGFVLVVMAAVVVVSPADLLLVGTALTFGIVMLSLVLLTGYGGFVSLAQLTFAGVGALVYARLSPPDLFGLVLAGLVAGLVGALVALPVLRLTGLYLALATLAFASLMDTLVFQDDQRGFGGYGSALTARRPTIVGVHLGLGGYVVTMGFVFALLGLGLLALRRGPVGRLVVAQRDSPAAVSTLGLDQRWFRVVLFSVSAAVAGFAGAMYAGLRGTIGAETFTTLQNLPLILLLVVFGATSLTGATLGGVGLMLLPVLESAHPTYAGAIFAVVGVGAILLAKDPNGLSSYLFRGGRLLLGRVESRLPPGLQPSPAVRARFVRPGEELDRPTAASPDPQEVDGRAPARG